jgi:IclR helix-turn-helix domain
MQAQNRTSVHRLDAPEAVAFLRLQRTLCVLQACLVEPQSLTDICGQTGLPMNSAGRYVQRLVRLGVLKVQSEQARAGRSIKHYVAVATAFFIPYDAEKDDLPDEIVRRLVEMRVGEQVRGLVAAAGTTLGRNAGAKWGTLVYADRNGGMVIRPDFEGGKTPDLLALRGSAYLNLYSSDLRLTALQAKSLQRDLVALFKQYKAVTGPQTYTLSIVLAPKPSIET